MLRDCKTRDKYLVSLLLSLKTITKALKYSLEAENIPSFHGYVVSQLLLVRSLY